MVRNLLEVANISHLAVMTKMESTKSRRCRHILCICLVWQHDWKSEEGVNDSLSISGLLQVVCICMVCAPKVPNLSCVSCLTYIYIDILYFRYIDHVHCASSISAVPYLWCTVHLAVFQACRARKPWRRCDVCSFTKWCEIYTIRYWQ